MRSFLLFASALAVLAACGTKGPLTLPAKATLADHSSKPVEPAG